MNRRESIRRLLRGFTLRRFLWIVMLVGGCLRPRLTLYGTPVSMSPAIDDVYPATVDFEVLGSTSAVACGSVRGSFVPATSGGRPSGPANPALYEAAKYQALENLPAADNIMYVRVKVENNGYEQCVTVTGRGYRVRRVHAGITDEGTVLVSASVPATQASRPVAAPDPPTPEALSAPNVP